MANRVRMEDIARQVGVSTVSVSKALADKTGVSPETREKVVRKAEELGYVYNSLPQSMLNGRTGNIGILVSEHYMGGVISFYWLFFQKLLETFRRTEYFGMLEIVSVEDEKCRALPALARAGKVDGFIILGQFSDLYLAALTAKMRPCLFLDFYSQAGGCDCVVTNNFQGSYDLTRLLLDAGHRRVAFIGTPGATTSILDRYMGYSKALMEAGAAPLPAIPDRDDTSTGYTESTLDLGAGESARCTAYVCNNDQLAGTVIRLLRNRGIHVPGDISIVGFDNDGTNVTGGIGVTSLAVDVDAMCEIAVTNLISKIETPDSPMRGKMFINGKIVTKESIAAPRRE